MLLQFLRFPKFAYVEFDSIKFKVDKWPIKQQQPVSDLNGVICVILPLGNRSWITNRTKRISAGRRLYLPWSHSSFMGDSS